MGDSKKKSVAIVAISSLVLVAVAVVAIVVISKQYNQIGDAHATASVKAVEALCQPTKYKQECMESLHGAIGNTTNPKELIKASFTFTKKKLAEIMDQSATLKEAEKDPMASQALAVCRDQMDLAIYHLEDSFMKMGALDVNNPVDSILSDLDTWLTSVVNFQDTCLYEFENVTSSAVDKIKDLINNSLKFSNNALLMVQEIKTIAKGFKLGNRRLLQDAASGEIPSWIDPARRRLLVDETKPNMVIAQDGSGNFKTFAEAIKALPVKSNGPFVVQVKAGVYREWITIPKEVWNVTWIGEGAEKTKIVFDKSVVGGSTTLYSASLSVQGAGHTFKDMGFENDAGTIKDQAVAVTVDGDRSAFFNCRFDAFQDTLYVHNNRQYYRDCTITGTIDFIFGDARAIFQNCLMLVRDPTPKTGCVVTAQGKKEPFHVTGIVIQNCTIAPHQSFMAVKGKYKTFLGRPWQEYATVVYMQSFIDDIIDPLGWSPMNGDRGLQTSTFVEYNNRGPGSNTSGRVTWNSIKHITPDQANEYTGATMLGDDGWVTGTGIPYVRTMMNI